MRLGRLSLIPVRAYSGSSVKTVAQYVAQTVPESRKPSWLAWANKSWVKPKQQHNCNYRIFPLDVHKTRSPEPVIQKEKVEGRNELRAHKLLCQQYFTIIKIVSRALESYRSLVPKHEVLDAEPLIWQLLAHIQYYLAHTQDDNKLLRELWVSDSGYPEMWRDWRISREKLRQTTLKIGQILSGDFNHAIRLDELLRRKLDAAYSEDCIPIESVVELAIQCILDMEAATAQTTDSLKAQFHKLQARFNHTDIHASAGLGMPYVVFLAVTSHGYHIGGSSIRFNLQRSEAGKVRNVFGDSFRKDISRAQERQLLDNIVGDAKKLATSVRGIHRSLKKKTPLSFRSFKTLQDETERLKTRSLHRDTPGVAFSPSTWKIIRPCAKCKCVYQFREELKSSDRREKGLRFHPFPSCGEDAWESKRCYLSGSETFNICISTILDNDFAGGRALGFGGFGDAKRRVAHNIPVGRSRWVL
ncbi:hypothetical protein B0O99DRAFT_676484 [Bisporella sp. PMI_857]|nr:hypothetical protein B0O99DRAFT_676484 [Bisporella sp. PMI_857]